MIAISAYLREWEWENKTWKVVHRCWDMGFMMQGETESVRV